MITPHTKIVDAKGSRLHRLKLWFRCALLIDFRHGFSERRLIDHELIRKGWYDSATDTLYVTWEKE